MQNLTKEELAILVITNDIAHDILIRKKFMYELKHEFSKIDKSIKRITKICFGNTCLDDLDLYKEKINAYMNDLINEKIELKSN